MITFVPEDEDENIPGLSIGYILLTNDSNIKYIEGILNTTFKNMRSFKALKDRDKNLATLLKTCTDLMVVEEIYWHPETLFDSLSKSLPNNDIKLVNYSVTDDRTHYKLDYTVRGTHHDIIIETDAVNELLDAINTDLVDRQFVKVQSNNGIVISQWALFPKDVNIEDLAKATYCIIKNS